MTRRRAGAHGVPGVGRAVACLALAVVAVLPGAGGERRASAASGADYRLGSTAWNGLRDFATLAAGRRCPAVATDRIAWDELTGTDVLWLLHPETPVDADRLARFLGAGGRALLADDYGGAAGALARLGLRRETGTPPDGARHLGRAGLPLARSVSTSALGRAAPSLVTNHPAWFVTAFAPTYELAPGAALVVEGSLGAGRYVALGDPSLLINNMLELDEDRRFAGALLASLCRPGVDRLVVVTGAFSEHGEPPAVLRGAPGSGDGDGDPATIPLPARANATLDRLGRDRPDPTIAFLLAVGAAAVALLTLAAALPLELPVASASWTRVAGAPVMAYAALVERYAAGRLRYGDALLAAVLRDEVTLRLTHALARAEVDGRPAVAVAQLGRLPADEVGRRVAIAFGDVAGDLARRLWRDLGAAAPGRALPLGPSSRRLARMHRRARDLFHLLPDPTDERNG